MFGKFVWQMLLQLKLYKNCPITSNCPKPVMSEESGDEPAIVSYGDRLTPKFAIKRNEQFNLTNKLLPTRNVYHP